MTRSLVPIPVHAIHAKFAQILGIPKKAVTVEVGTSKTFEIQVKGLVKEIDAEALSDLVDLIHEHKLDASTLHREDYGVAVILRKRVQICHPEEGCR